MSDDIPISHLASPTALLLFLDKPLGPPAIGTLLAIGEDNGANIVRGMSTMTTSFAHEPDNRSTGDGLPSYACMLHAYHRAHADDLRAMVATLPLARASRVLDVAAGDGCYSIWLAERAAHVVG